MGGNHQFDLLLQRDVSVSVQAVWRAWTTPELLLQWFCPRPWKVVACEVDLRPGGLFRSVMQSPEGQDMPPNEGCYLLVDPPHRLVWTNVLGPGFRPRALQPQAHASFAFVVELHFEPLPSGGTHYQVRVMHADAAGRDAHAAMGFEQGWGLALDQLVELMQTQA